MLYDAVPCSNKRWVTALGRPSNTSMTFRMTKQKAHLVRIDGTGQVRGLDELNVAFGRGWTFVSATPFGGSSGSDRAGECLAILVIVRREDRTAESLLDAVEEEADELLDDLVEGDGSNQDLDIDPEA
jgi:hypothetical protein